TALDVVTTLFDADAALAAVRSGTIDASFRAVTLPARQLPDGVESARVFDEPIQLLTGPAHEYAAARAVTPAQLAGHRIWMPGVIAGTEWAAYYDELAAEFGLTIEATGPDFGTEPLLDTIADSASLATFVGAQTRLVWPADQDLRRVPVHDPTPVYPHSLIWRSDNPHPALTTLRTYLGAARPAHRDDGTWTPAWAR
ncbi:LysR substrate-binding domain-containing protein, partial [Streptomyces nigrescens]